MLKGMEQLIRQENMLPRGSRVLCAVSGGADSVCLLGALYHLREQLGITLLCAHYNHRLRGEESDRDEKFVRELVKTRFPGVELRVGSGDVAVRAKERGVPVVLWSRLQKGEALEGYFPEDVLGEPRTGLKLLYATDSRPVARMTQLAENVDLLILEGMFGQAEKLERAKEARHMLMQEAAQIAREADAKQLWLTHFSPANPEPEQFLEELQSIFPETCIGTDGLYMELRFSEP